MLFGKIVEEVLRFVLCGCSVCAANLRFCHTAYRFKAAASACSLLLASGNFKF